MILDDLATPKAYAQTRQPNRHVRPVLLPSTKRTIASKAWAWFLAIASIFLLFPVALVASLLFFLSFFNQSFSEEFFAMLKVSVRGHHSPPPITPTANSPRYVPPHKWPNHRQLLETRP